MRSNIFLLLISGVTSMMALAAENDSFALYHAVIEERLTALLEPRSAAPRIAPEVTERSELGIVPATTVGDFAGQFWGRPAEAVSAALSRLQRYRPTIELILEQEGVPKSLVAVVLVESGAQPLALSPKQARGLWQFVPGTARQYGLTVTPNKDERVDVEQSTRAAARYLRDLYKRFGDWQLVLAAYNAGPDAVQRALQRGHATTYAQISAATLLPEETRKYVPAILSAIELLGTARLAVQWSATKVQSVILNAPMAITN